MANRRTLGDAMTLSSDKLAFVQGTEGKVAALAATPPKQEMAPSPLTVVPPEPGHELMVEEDETRAPTGRSPSRSSRSKSRNEEIDDTILLRMSRRWVPLTTKLQPRTAAALKRAGLEQRLRGGEPATVQEIVEIAVADWLVDQGYL